MVCSFINPGIHPSLNLQDHTQSSAISIRKVIPYIINILQQLWLTRQGRSSTNQKVSTLIVSSSCLHVEGGKIRNFKMSPIHLCECVRECQTDSGLDSGLQSLDLHAFCMGFLPQSKKHAVSLGLPNTVPVWGVHKESQSPQCLWGQMLL